MFDNFVRKFGLIQELGQLIWYLVGNTFMENIYRKSALKASAIPLFNFGKLHKTKQQMHTIYIYIYILLLLLLLLLLFPSSPLFPFVGKVYDLINWLKDNLKVHIVILFDILRRILDLLFFNCYLASPRPTFDSYRSLTLC